MDVYCCRQFCDLWSQGLCGHWAVHLNLVLLFPSFHFFLGSKHNVDTAVIIDVVLSFCICIHLETLNVGNNCVVSSNHFDAITLF